MVGGQRRKEIKVMFANAQSIVNKIDEVKAIMAVNKPDIMAMTETWTHGGIGDDYLNVDGYELILRSDRNDTENGRGGGIIIYVNKEMNVRKLDEIPMCNQTASIEFVSGGEKIRVHVVYRSPNSKKANDDGLCQWVKEMRGTNILIGDFNFPDIDWANGVARSKGRDFLEATAEQFLEQYVTEPTHTSGNVLDLVLCNKEIIKEVRTEGRIGRSDHDIVAFNITVTRDKDQSQRMLPNYGKANFEEMRRKMAEKNWKRELEGKDVNEMWISIRGFVRKIMSDHIPAKKRRAMKDPPWMDGDIRRCIREKKAAWKKWKETKKEKDRNEYKKKGAETKKKIRKKKNSHEKKVAECRKTNPKMFYAFINRAKKTRSRIGPLTNNDGDVITDPKEQANILNNQYVSVFTRDDGVVPSVEAENANGEKIEDICVDREVVLRVIDNLKEQSAAGPDGIPPRVIKELRNEIAEPLAILFRESLDTGRIPDDWRDAEVTPIYKKKGKKSEAANYRPVSLTNVTGKLMERIVKEALTDFIEKNDLFSDTQHGFRTGRSVQTNLIEFNNETTKWLDEGKSFDVLFLDYAKAFDKVSHQRLVVKLEAIGIKGKLLMWLKDWLRGRRQRVKVEGEFSEWVEVLSSVVQGSVLGGTLFDIFINDIWKVVLEAIILLFADDTKVAKTVQNEDDAKRMQEIIDRLEEWSIRWGMSFNADKCKIMHVGRNNPEYKYTMGGREIGRSSAEKDLGIWMEATLKPSKQCAVAARKANFTLGQIQRSFHYRTKKNLVPLFKSFVRPQMECAVQAWCPWNEGDKKCLEKVQ